MEKKWQMLICKNNSLWVLLLVMLSCTNQNNSSTYIVDNKYKPTLDSVKQLLKDGDIILRLGNDVTSSMFASLNRTNQSFSHCGIFFKEHDTCYVYHSIGGEDNPNEKLKKDTIETFVSNKHNIAYGVCRYTLTPTQIDTLKQIVHNYYYQKIPFDMDFDLHTDNKMYCAEMVYKALKHATHDSLDIPTTDSKLLHFVSTDNIYVNKYAHLLCEIKYK